MTNASVATGRRGSEGQGTGLALPTNRFRRFNWSIRSRADCAGASGGKVPRRASRPPDIVLTNQASMPLYISDRKSCMTNTLYARLRRGGTLAALIASVAVSPVGAQAQQAAPSAQAGNTQPAAIPMPNRAQQLILLQSTLAALDQANRTGDYGVLVKLSARQFQLTNTPEELAGGFRGFRENGIDLSPILLYAPRWTQEPRIENGVLRMVGVFDTNPQQVTFDLAFILEEGRWKMVGISAGLNAPRAAP